MIKKFIGSGSFYLKTFAVILPILVQNVISNFVNLLDNIMVGQVGTEQMSGVAIVNQLLFVFYLATYGIMAGGGIFTAQFYGKGDNKGVADSFKMKLYSVATLLCIAYAVFLFAGPTLIKQFLHDGGDGFSVENILKHGKEYLRMMLWGLFPVGLTQVYSSTLRETGCGKVPMIAGLCAVLVNLCGNWLLIYGNLGFPEMGIKGAALATVISRYIELSIVLIWSHANQKRARFAQFAYKDLRVPAELVKKIFVTGTPMFINELLWSLGQTVMRQNLSTRGTTVVAAMNISMTVMNLFTCAYIATGASLAIIIGQNLGAGDTEKAIDENRKIMTLALGISLLLEAVILLFARDIPNLYNTTDSVKELAVIFIRISSIYMPFDALANACYNTMRCGGKTLVTFLFDCCFVWVVSVPLAYSLAHFTTLPIIPFYTILYSTVVIKVIIGLILVSRRKWVNNLVQNI